MLGGWQMNLITFYQTGSPFNVTCSSTYPSCDWNADGQTGDRLNAPTRDLDLGSKTQEEWLAGVFTTADFPKPSPGQMVGTLGRNVLRGPNYFSSDLALLKNFELPWFSSKSSTLQIRVEAFNLFNQVNLNNPSSSYTSTTFGRVTSSRTMRTVQLGAKLMF